MPYLRKPNSRPSVIRLFKKAIETYKNTPNPADRAIGEDLWAKLTDADPTNLGSRFLKESSEVDLALATQAPLTTAISQCAARLTMYCSHFHQVLDLGIARGTFAPGTRRYYGRDIADATLPDLSSYDAVCAAAQNIVDGEARRAAAEAAGFARYGVSVWGSGARYASANDVVPHVPMALPSAADVGALLAEFKAFRNQVQTAERATNREQEEAMALYPDAQELGEDICDTVEFFYRKDPDAASRRAKCEQWGLVYVFEDNAPPAPAAPPATPTAPA
jgi:hypothetical protein